MTNDVKSHIQRLVEGAAVRELSDDLIRMLVGFEVAGQHEELYGVDYVAGEWGEHDADVDRKIEVFISEVADGDTEAYRDIFDRIESRYEQEIDEAMQTHTTRADEGS